MPFGFESFPSHVESDGVEPPFLHVLEVFLDQRVVGVEHISRWIIRKLFKDNIESMHNSDSVVLISQNVEVWV